MVQSIFDKIDAYWKAIVAIVGVVGQVATVALVGGTAQHWVQVVVAGVTAIGVWWARNETKIEDVLKDGNPLK